MMVTFKSDIKKRKQVFTAESFAHPAKMHLGMLLWVVGAYTKPGETILDPMFGSGSTMLAARYGRNVIGVELEQKFVDMAKANWDKVVSLPKTKFGLGECQIIQGDARDLEGLLVDSIITSPPYSAQINAMHRSSYPREPSPIAEEKNLPRAYSTNPDNIGNLPHGDIDAIISSPPYENTKVPPHTPEGEALRLEIAKQRGVSPDKVSYMDYTRKQPDVILSSPPFGDMNHSTNYLGKQKGESGFEYSADPSNIGNLSYGKVDSIISSPPYGAIKETTHASLDAEEGRVYQDKRPGRQGTEWEFTGQKKEKYSEDKNNIGNLSYGKVDTVLTSPPYEGSLQGDVEDKISSGFNSPQAIKKIQGQARGYSKEPSNIGNLRSDTYLGAMLKVYQQCYKVLKPNGLMILVTKDFIRNQKRILLSIDTIALCEQAGFTYEDWHQRKLTQQSFWRTLYYQKHPEVERLDTEDILVFRKPGGEGMVDAVVTSPPYAETFSVHAGGNMRLTELGRKTTDLSAEEKQEAKELAIYSRGEDNISNLPYGSIDTIVSSPPYSNSPVGGGLNTKPPRQGKNDQSGRSPNSPSQIGAGRYDGARINDEWIKSRQAVD